MTTFHINLAEITSRETFHSTFQRAMKFFDGYGRNMDAWIDCMTSLHGKHALSKHQLPEGESIELVLKGWEAFASRCPDIAASLTNCTASANHRYQEVGSKIRLAIIFE